MNGEEAYALSKALTAQTAAGLKNYQISDTGLLTMETADGRVLSYQFRQPEDGVSVTDVAVNDDDHLIITYSDGQVDDAGLIKTLKGDPGLGIKSLQVDDRNHLIVTYDDGSTQDAGKINTSGGSSELQADLLTTISLGGIDVGTLYEEGTPIEELLRDLLEPIVYPILTPPSVNIDYAVSSFYPVGGTVPSHTAQVIFDRGSIDPSYGTSGYRSGAATMYQIATDGADTEYSDSSAGSGSFDVPALTRAAKGNITLTGTVSYEAGEQPKDSAGDDYSSPLPAGSVTETKTLKFIIPYYYGASDTHSVSSLSGLTQDVSEKGDKKYRYTTNNQYMVIAYDAAYGDLDAILDSSGFDLISGWTKSTAVIGGLSYIIYVADSPTLDTNAPISFKY